MERDKNKLTEELTSALKDTHIRRGLRTSKHASKNEMICWFYFIADVKIVALKIMTRRVNWFWHN
jgi:hypothetical protein